MKRLTTRGIATAQAIRDREEFRTSGSLRAEVVNGLSRWDSGILSGDDLEKFNEDCADIRYVVYSYSTPIAWWAGTWRGFENMEPGWYVVSQKFSRTTSKHQGNLYLIRPERAVVHTPSFDCETEALALSDCKHWDKPGTECAGPRVGRTPDGVILCERHFNQTGA